MKQKRNHFPRNGQYELFTYMGKTYCFDDLELGSDPAVTNAPEEMWTWLRNQEGCRALGDYGNTAYYLDPRTYLIWKLKYAYRK